ncbi:hypothetical protein MMC29_005412, partial [Sticta canariensis]|nr:hypothetical protein [Sticta canariensis]
MSKRGGYSDPLADPPGCIRDVPCLKELQINVTRTFIPRPVESDSECIAVFAQA